MYGTVLPSQSHIMIMTIFQKLVLDNGIIYSTLVHSPAFLNDDHCLKLFFPQALLHLALCKGGRSCKST